MIVPGSRLPLIASVVLNVFLAGGLAGGATWVYLNRPMPGGNLQMAAAQLPDADRRAFQDTLRGVRRDNRDLVAQAREARHDAADLLRQPAVDTQALTAALDRARAADVALRTKLEQRIAEFAAASPPGVRFILAEGLERHLPPRAARQAAPKKSP